MRNKTYKLQKLERNRTSILTDDLSKCYVCHYPIVDIHEVFGGANRQVSMKNGFCVPLCREHHRQVTDDNSKNLYFKRKVQKKYEENHTREEWLSLIGKNYLED